MRHFCLVQNLKSQGSLQLLKHSWYVLSPDIKKVVNDASFRSIFQGLWNYDTIEYKGLQLIMALCKRF